MGAGKTTLGRLLAQATGWRYFDNDEEMSQRYGFTQEELASMSVPDLHALESRYLIDVLAQEAPLITGAAASVVDYSDNRALLESVVTIYLKIPLNAVIARAGTSGVGRQALTENGEAILTERYERRDPLYKSVSVATLDLSDNPASDAEKLIQLVTN